MSVLEDIEKLETFPRREAMHRHRPANGCQCSWCYEKRTEHYPAGRVLRWLSAHVGTKWDDIVREFVNATWLAPQYRQYSKLCEHVEVNTFMRDKEVWSHADYHPNNEFKIADSYYRVFYVDPRTHDLCCKKRVPRTRRAVYEEEERKTMRILGDYHQLLRINGIWYEVRGEPGPFPFNAEKYGPRARMMWDKPNKGRKDWTYLKHCMERPRIVLKRQLNTQDLQFHKLRNEIDNEFTRAMKYAKH